MACVVKRRGKYVLDYYDQNGKRRWETTKGNKKEAELLLAQRLQEIDRGGFQAKSQQITFEELAKAYIENCKVNVRDITAVEYDEDIQRHILPYFTTRRLRSITRKDVEDFRAWLVKRGEEGLPVEGRKGRVRKFGASTVNKCLTLLSMMFGYALEHEWIAKNPAARIAKIKSAARALDEDEQGEALEQSEIQALLNNASPAWRLLMRTAVGTGLRQCELLGLRWIDVDLEVGSLRVRRSYRFGTFYEPKTATSRRTVPIGADLLSELKRWKLACPRAPRVDGGHPLDLVFPTRTGKPQNPGNLLSRGFHPARQKAKLRPMKFHGLRHTFGSHLIAAGVDLKTVSELMGHSSIKVTVDIYGHMLKGSAREAITRLEASIGSKMVATADFGQSAEDVNVTQLLVSTGGSGGTRGHELGIGRPEVYAQPRHSHGL